MTLPGAVEYHRSVPDSRPRAGRRLAAGILLSSAVLGWPRGACAATTSYDVSGQAVVQVIGHTGSIVIRTWNRDTVQIDWPDGAAFVASKTAQATRSSFLIPTVGVEEERGPGGTVSTTLLPEDFPVPRLAPGMHDVVRVEQIRPLEPGKPASPAPITLMIPESTGLVNVRTERGAVSLSDYRGTTIAADRRGRMTFSGVSGDAFVQPLNGSFYAIDSTFDRLRIRSNRADLVFDACRVKQIEATTLTGNIVFDNGVFDPGLARFESDRGSIALGVNGGAQVGAHTFDGQVLTALRVGPTDAPPPLIGRDENDTVRVVGNGGPLVSTSTNHGDILLFDGSLAERRPAMLGAGWRPMADLLFANREYGRSKPIFAARPLRRSPQLPARRNAESHPTRSE
jgi:hypothetical protein